MTEQSARRGRRSAIVGGLLLLVVVLTLLRLRRRSPHGVATGPDPSDTATSMISLGTGAEARAQHGLDAENRDAAAVLTHTVRDRALRDEFRRQIYSAWRGPPAPSAAPRVDPLRAPMPEHDGGGVDPSYIRERIREDFLPMASICYEQLLTRRPGTAGRTVMSFTVVGDTHVGGVVDNASINAGDGGLAEPEFETCMRESMMAMAFRPPSGSGSLTVTYPFRLEPGAADAATASNGTP